MSVLRFSMAPLQRGNSPCVTILLDGNACGAVRGMPFRLGVRQQQMTNTGKKQVQERCNSQHQCAALSVQLRKATAWRMLP